MMACKEARDRMSQLETAIKRLDLVKKHLNRNASDIKAEIHANVSRNLECLRGREVSLLSEVDQVLGVKEETLQQQQARLNQALGVLQTGLSMVQDDSASQKQLADTLAKLNSIELSPVETPYVAFRADHVGLRESILNYGRVDANGLPLMTAFDDPGNPSASLPRHVEDYEDADHHVFYKTVEEVKRSQNSTSCHQITVSIPKLSTRVEDWLQKKLPNTKSTDVQSPAKRLPAIRPCTLAKLGETPSGGISRTSTPGSSCSLNNWLSLIKQHADLEEEHDFEIVDNSSMQRGLTSSHTDVNHMPKDYFSHIEKDLQAWVNPKSSATTTKETYDFFKHIHTDTKIWLLQACKQLTSLDQSRDKDFFQHISKEPSSWLRTRAHGKQQPVSADSCGEDFFSHISNDKENWLLKKAQDASTERKTMAGEDCPERDVHDPIRNSSFSKMHQDGDAERWLMRTTASTPSFELEDVCRANELCCSLSKCASQPDCITMYLQEKSSVKNPVDPSQIFKPLCLPNEKWLSLPSSGQEEKTGVASKSEPDEESVDIFGHIPDSTNSIWLMKPVLTKSMDTSSVAKFKDDKEENNLWLQKAKGSPGESESVFCPTSLCVDSDLSEWLFVPGDKEKEVAENVKEKEESEGWSICSDEHSMESEQYMKDVATASDYFTKWLL